MTMITPTTRRLLLVPAVALLAPAALAACGSDDDEDTDATETTDAVADDSDDEAATDTQPPTTEPDGGDATAAIDIVSVPDGFGPSTITVDVGTEVVWTNTDGAPHTATAAEGAWDSGSLSQGDTFSFTATEAGTFAYFCAIHPSMVGELIVE